MQGVIQAGGWDPGWGMRSRLIGGEPETGLFTSGGKAKERDRHPTPSPVHSPQHPSTQRSPSTRPRTHACPHIYRASLMPTSDSTSRGRFWACLPTGLKAAAAAGPSTAVSGGHDSLYGEGMQLLLWREEGKPAPERCSQRLLLASESVMRV